MENLMEDEWLDYYSDITNLEDYYTESNEKNPNYDFVKRKFSYWVKYHQELKKNDPKYYKFYHGKKLSPEILAYDCLSEYEKKLIIN